jgi:hypothetical protein
MPKRQIRINLSEAQWLVVEKQRQLGGYRSIANTIQAEVIIYQESFTSHLSAPYLPQSGAKQPHIAPTPPPLAAKPIQPAPVNPNNPNGF